MKIESVIFNLNEDDKIFKNILKNLEFKKPSLEKGEVRIPVFSDGETCPYFKTSVRGKRAYLLTSPNTPLKIMQLMLAIDALKRASATEIIPIIPYFPYARQDKRDQYRGPIGARVMAEMIEGRGATSIITLDLHADQIEGFFKIPVIHLRGKYLFHNYIAGMSDSNTVLCSPDAGGLKRVKKFRDLLYRRNNDINLRFVSLDKTRSKANVVAKMEVLGNVKNKNVLIIDDMCDTGGTLAKAAETLMENGATQVRALVTHPVLSGDGFRNIVLSPISEFITSDSIVHKITDENTEYVSGFMDKTTFISVDKAISDAILSINNDISLIGAK